MNTYTHKEIANSWDLWIQFVDPAGVGTKAEFDSLSESDKLKIIRDCFGDQ